MSKFDVLIMAGGLGGRMGAATENTPKAMLKVGGKPILEIIIDQLTAHGARHFYISTNYLSEQIESYFGDGQKKEISIKYLPEEQALGTIGALTNLKKVSKAPILIINADILTDLDFTAFYESFVQSKADFYVATIKREVCLPYAVLELENQQVKHVEEKPSKQYLMNAGIYFTLPSVIAHLQENVTVDAPAFINTLIEKGCFVGSFLIDTYWRDIGTPSDYQKANAEVGELSLSSVG